MSFGPWAQELSMAKEIRAKRLETPDLPLQGLRGADGELVMFCSLRNLALHPWLREVLGPRLFWL